MIKIKNLDNEHFQEFFIEIHQKLLETDIIFSWHEFNGQHAFMRDEGDRYDPELAMLCYQLCFRMFSRTLNN